MGIYIDTTEVIMMNSLGCLYQKSTIENWVYLEKPHTYVKRIIGLIKVRLLQEPIFTPTTCAITLLNSQ